MERITLGKTGMTVNRFGFGGIPIQRVDEKQAVETVLHAVETGVDFIDTARSYGASEERIGKALRETDRRVVIATKSQDKTRDGMRRDIDTSLKLLGRESIDLYQCHFVRNAEEYQQIISRDGALAGVREAKEQGLVKHIGITSHSLDLMEKILDDDLFETIMVCFSFLEPEAKKTVIPKAKSKGVGVIAMKSLSGGVIEQPHLAIGYALSHPGVVIIPGVESTELFDENWKIYRAFTGLTDEDRSEIERIRSTHDKQFCHRCDYCLPCPEDIYIQIVLWLPSVIKRTGPEYLKRDFIRRTLENAKKCTQCGECMTKCPYNLPIPDLIQERVAWVEEQMEKS